MTALHVEAHRAPDDDPAAVYPVQGVYVERFWLPQLGPTATLVLRLLDQMLDSSGDRPVRSTLVELGAMVGVHTPHKMRGAVERFERCDIEVNEAQATYFLLVPRRLPAVAVRRRTRWPAGLVALHDVAAEIFAEPLNSTSEASMERP